MGMNIFVTGGSGFVGRHLLQKLNADSRIGTIYCLFRKMPSRLGDKVRPVIGDVTSCRFSIPEDIACMVHLAGSAGRSSSSSLKAANIEGTKHILKCCQEQAISRILYLSSINVKLKNMQYYGKTKQVAEALIAASGLAFTIFRPALIYGPDNPAGAVSKIARVLARYHIMPVFGDGQAFEQPIYIDDVVDFVAAALFNPVQGIFEIGGADALRYTDLVECIAQRLHVAHKNIHLPYRLLCRILQKFEARDRVFALSVEQIEHQLQDLCIDNTEASEAFGVVPRDFATGLGYLTHANA